MPESFNFLIRHKWVGILGLAVVLRITIWEVKKTPTGFIPAEDQNFVIVSFNLPPSSSLDRTNVVLKKIDSLLSEIPQALTNVVPSAA